jgi:hypothetical protein
VNDYEARYGQIPVGSQYELTSSIQQFTSEGALIPETPNRRALQVLAAVDFFTTLGSGKIGGQIYAGSPLDAGYTEATESAASRLPQSSTSPAWRVLTRAFSEGQNSNTSHASLGIKILSVTAMAGTTITFTIPNVAPVTLTAVAGAPSAGEFQVGGSSQTTANNISNAILNDATLSQYLTASNSGTPIATVVATDVGAVGNRIRVSISAISNYYLLTSQPANAVFNVTDAYLSGGVDRNANAGNGTSQINLTGMTERLPLGILLQDSDFLCENPLVDNSSALTTLPPGIQPVQTVLPLGAEGDEYTRFLGGPGQWVGMSDGGVLEYEAYNAISSPSGTRKFRLYRGGGSAFVLTDPVPGGPIDWVGGSFAANLQPVLKGGVLVCKALLVRNLPEEAFSVPQTTSHGDEVQMVILTYGILGKGDSQESGVALSGVISPTGYGEGYAAADRYRIEGHPMSTGRARTVSTFDAEPALYPGDGAEPVETS